MTMLLVFNVVFATLSIVAASYAMRADTRTQEVRRTVFAVLDAVREEAAKLGQPPSPAQLTDGAPYRTMGTATGTMQGFAMDSTELSRENVISVIDAGVGKVALSLSRYSVSHTHGRAMEALKNPCWVECSRTSTPMPGEVVEVVISRTQTT